MLDFGGIKMTAEERKAEWKYRYDERIGMLCEDREPTSIERAIACDEANRACRQIQKQDEAEALVHPEKWGKA